MKSKQTNYIQIVPVVRPAVKEYFIQAVCESDAQVSEALAELLAFLQQQEARVVNFRGFVKADHFERLNTAMQAQLGALQCPVMWMCQPDKPGIPLVSFQAHAVAGVTVEPITENGQNAGCRFQDDHAEYTFLYVPSSTAECDRFRAAVSVFDQMQHKLQAAGLDFSRTLRTWLFAEDILAWYDKLNLARDNFFTRHDIFNQLVPASTGIGITNPAGVALQTDLLAVRPLNGEVQIQKIASPLQCEALNYKSSFSRAVRLTASDHSRLYVSGTAGIAPDGKTAYLDDCPKQLELTMQVVQALIRNGSMEWTDSVRAIAYFKDSRDFDLFDGYCQQNGINIPHVKVEADVCRHDLLFELELDLLSL